MEVEVKKNFNDEAENVKTLMTKIKENEEKLEKADNKLKEMTTARIEMYRIIQEKDKSLAKRLLESQPDIERLIVATEENHQLKNKFIINSFPKNNEPKEYLTTEKLMEGANVNPEEVQLNVPSQNKSEGEEVFKEDENYWQYVLVFKNYGKETDTILEKKKVDELFEQCFSKTKTAEKEDFEKLLKGFLTIKNEKPYYKKFVGCGTKATPANTEELNNLKDIYALIRNITMKKLKEELKLETNCVPSKIAGVDLDFVLIHASDEVLKKHAEEIKYPLQLEIGLTDLISLLPCDEKLRPYCVYQRIKEKPNNIIELEKEVLERLFDYSLFLEDLKELQRQEVTEDTNITKEDWEAYAGFLNHISKNKNNNLNPDKEKETLKSYYIRKLIEDAFIHVNKNIKRLKNVWDYFETKPIGAYKAYNKEEKMDGKSFESYWKQYDAKGKISIFVGMDRIKLIISLLNSQLKMGEMKNLEFLDNFFPLHSSEYIKEIIEAPINPKEQKPFKCFSSCWCCGPKIPDEQKSDNNINTLRRATTSSNFTSKNDRKEIINEIRNYFGEKIAFYNMFLLFYKNYLLILGILGIIVYIIQTTDSLQSKTVEYFHELGFKKSRLVIAANTIYSFVVIIWSSIFLENWKRKQAKLALEWGQSILNEEFNEDNTNTTNLPTFKGIKRRSPTNDNLNEEYYPYYKRMIWKVLAYLISIWIVIIVLIIVIYLLYFRNWLVVNKVWGVGNKVVVNMPTVLNIVQINLFNLIYKKLALLFNKYENHKTYDSYESSLATKIFIFQFVNSFNSLIIISFIKYWIDFMKGCVKATQFGKSVSAYNFCDEELQNQIVTIAIVNLLMNGVEILVPYIQTKFKGAGKNNNTASESKLENSLIKQYNLNDYNEGIIDGTFNEYLEILIQFGFVILFAMAFPLLPIIAYFTNMVEFSVDFTKLTKFSKRPNPISTNGIGIWFYLFEMLSFLAIFSNLGILIFTYNDYSELTGLNKAVLFICLVSFYIISRLAISRLIPDVSQNCIDIKNRHEVVLDKINKRERLLNRGETKSV